MKFYHSINSIEQLLISISLLGAENFAQLEASSLQNSIIISILNSQNLNFRNDLSILRYLRHLVLASRRHKYNRESIFILEGSTPLSRGRSFRSRGTT